MRTGITGRAESRGASWRLGLLISCVAGVAGCTSGVSEIYETSGGDTDSVRVVFERRGQRLTLGSAPKKGSYEATYPNPLGLQWLEARVLGSGAVIVACDSPDRRRRCGESPVSVRIDRAASVVIVKDVYGELLAELPYDPNADECPAPKQTVTQTDPSGNIGTVEFGLEELGGNRSACQSDEDLDDDQDRDPSPEDLDDDHGDKPGVGAPTAEELEPVTNPAATCDGAMKAARELFCKGLNERLDAYQSEFTYDCTHLDGTFVVPPGPGPVDDSPQDDLGCKSDIIDPVLDPIRDAFDDAQAERCEVEADIIDGWRLKAREELFNKGVCGSSPLALDLDGGGVELTTLSGGVTFDLFGLGQAVRTAWLAPGEAWLVRDVNGNGRIDDGTELFGQHTDKASHPDGFAALASLDTNRDGRVDGADPAFRSLRLWRDTNRDGVGPKEEWRSLAQAGVKALLIRSQRVQGSTLDGRGNRIPLVGTFVRTDGTEGLMADVFLRHEPPAPASALLADAHQSPRRSAAQR